MAYTGIIDGPRLMRVYLGLQNTYDIANGDPVQPSFGSSQIIDPAGTNTTLTAAQSGATVLLDAAAGVVLTLPAPTVGLRFRFLAKTTVTSNSYKIITDAATTFLLGEILAYTTATASPAGFAFNGSTHVACTLQGATFGGLIGTDLSVLCINATQWIITGTSVGSGTLVTPAATS